MGNKRNPSVVVAVRVILLFIEDFDGRIFPPLGDFSRSPHIDEWIMKVADKLRVVEFQYLRYTLVWGICLFVVLLTIAYTDPKRCAISYMSWSVLEANVVTMRM